MDTVTILWSFGAALAIIMAVLCGALWLIERRDHATLVLCILGVATAASAYTELGMLYAATPAEYGEWLRWYLPPAGLALVSMLLFVHYYLGTGRVWLLCALIFARCVVVVVNFSVHPNFNFSNIVSLRHVSLLGEQVSAVDVAAVRTEWQWFATASVILLIVYIIDAARRRWLAGGRESRRRALAVSLGIVVPLLCTAVYGQLLIYGVLQGAISNLPWFLGTLLTMAYELGRDVVLSRRARLELAEARAQLAQVERVSILGQLASTLVHELIQPLAATSVNMEAALWQMKNKKPNLEQLRGILADVSSDNRRAVDIIDGMRQLFKRRSIAMQPLRLEDLVQHVVWLVRAEANSNHIAVSLRMQPGLPLVSGDRVHLSQVLLNLLMNSIHAVQSRPLHARRIGIEARADDAKSEVEVTVLDSGPGIPDDCLDAIFKPFFTTKSEGMGIGLALSRTIIEAHGGRMWTDRASQHEGAVFRFSLQRAERAANVQTFVKDENKLIVANSGPRVEMDLARKGRASA